jgi:hypothetical protein
MFAVLAEDDSDAATLEVLVKSISKIENQQVLKKGFGGCGALRSKSHRFIKEFSRLGATRFIICHDADGEDPAHIRRGVRTILSKNSCRGFDVAVIVPVEELEAWILADPKAITEVISTFAIRERHNPESVRHPKEWLRDQSRRGRTTPIYPGAVNPESRSRAAMPSARSMTAAHCATGLLGDRGAEGTQPLEATTFRSTTRKANGWRSSRNGETGRSAPAPPPGKPACVLPACSRVATLPLFTAEN